MERLTLFRMFKQKDELKDEILKYDFSILHCKACLNPIFEIGKSERIRGKKNRKLDRNQEEEQMGVNHKNTCLQFSNLLYLIMQSSCIGKRFVT